jgi:Zn-dependent protease
MLFIHEVGHYVGMWKFGYKNLKMFFIPFFGAAVNGYACVSVVKESIVYLLGPIPGILIGLIFVIFYLFTHENIWFDAARIFITINTLNLLPLYPLDGGQFVFGILPQKTYKIQWLFQAAFIILTVFILFQFDTNIAGGLIGFVLARSWHLYKYNRVASKLLATGIINSKMPDDIIPSEVAPEIISMVQDETKFSKPKEIAASTWAVWARVKAKRPTLREQVYLALTYVSALVLGIGLSVMFFH